MRSLSSMNFFFNSHMLHPKICKSDYGKNKRLVIY